MSSGGQDREAERDRGQRRVGLGDVAVGARRGSRRAPAPARRARARAPGRASRRRSRRRCRRRPGRAAGTARVDRGRVGQHRQREDLAAGVPDADQRRRRRTPRPNGADRASTASSAPAARITEDDEVALLLADPGAERRPRRREQQRRADEADEQDRRRALAVEHVGGQVVDAGEHAAGGERLHARTSISSSRKSRAPATIRSWSRSVPGPGCDRADRRAPGAAVGATHADHDDERPSRRPSRGSRPGRRPRRGSPARSRRRA